MGCLPVCLPGAVRKPGPLPGSALQEAAVVAGLSCAARRSPGRCWILAAQPLQLSARTGALPCGLAQAGPGSWGWTSLSCRGAVFSPVLGVCFENSSSKCRIQVELGRCLLSSPPSAHGPQPPSRLLSKAPLCTPPATGFNAAYPTVDHTLMSYPALWPCHELEALPAVACRPSA